jgi:hypothetical protein
MSSATSNCFLRQRLLRFLARGGQHLAAHLGFVQRLARLVEPGRQRLNFGLEGEDLIRLGVNERRALVPLADELGDLTISLRYYKPGFVHRGCESIGAVLCPVQHLAGFVQPSG